MVVRDRIELSTFRFSEGLSSTWEPVSNAAPQPALPADGPVRSLRQQFSRCANVCRVMPFRPCYPRVGPLPDPDLCCSCVGRSRPGQPSRLRLRPSAPARGPKTGRRRPSTWSATHPATPAARPGITHRDERNVHRRIKPPISLPNTSGRVLCRRRGLLRPYRPVRAPGRALVRREWCGLSGSDARERKRRVPARTGSGRHGRWCWRTSRGPGRPRDPVTSCCGWLSGPAGGRAPARRGFPSRSPGPIRDRPGNRPCRPDTPGSECCCRS